MERTGLACKHDGTNTGGNLAMNATSCDRTGLIVQCVGTARELRLVGSSFNASWSGNQMTGVTTSTYNVLTTDDKHRGRLDYRHSQLYGDASMSVPQFSHRSPGVRA